MDRLTFTGGCRVLCTISGGTMLTPNHTFELVPSHAVTWRSTNISTLGHLDLSYLVVQGVTEQQTGRVTLSKQRALG